MKIVFMGTPDFAVEALKKIAQKHDVVAVYTQPPREAGRGNKVLKTPVNLAAEELGIPVFTPVSLKKEEEQLKLKSLGADIAVVAAYGLLLPKAVLDAFSKGVLNIHASLLPRWRGAAPIQRAIEAGDSKSGVTIMQVDEGLDTGDMLLKGEVEIDETTTGGILHDKLASLGADLIVKALEDLDQLKPQKQDDHLSCYAQKLDKSEAKLNFELTAEELERKIRAFNPFPGAYFEYKGERFKVFGAEVLDDNAGMPAGSLVPNDSGLLIECQKGMLFVTQIQRQGKKVMSTEELLRGFSFEDGTILNAN